MLHPSYTELMERINKDVEEGDTPIVQSRYSIVKATADRAKQIIDARAIGDKIEKQIKNDPDKEPVISDSQHLIMKKGSPLIQGNVDDMKPLSIAIDELYKGVVKISERSETGSDDKNINDGSFSDVISAGSSKDIDDLNTENVAEKDDHADSDDSMLVSDVASHEA